ncbi:MAG TPA: hypothetical protein VHI93_05945 [Candidatus Thermoplasmatota archaeon]|nr:hypothetical protein [Candidatus Thermoplasmatota archaeon]
MSAADWFSTSVATAALLLSGITFYLTQLRKFRLRTTFSRPVFRLFRIDPSFSGNKAGKTWWMPTLTLTATFHNEGNQSGEIQDIRARMRFATKKGQRRIEWVLNAQWFMDETALRNTGTRAQFLKAVRGDWYPLLVRGLGEVTRTVDLEFGRTVVQRTGQATVLIEVLVEGSPKWRQLGRFKVWLGPGDYEKGGGMRLFDPERAAKIHPDAGYPDVLKIG